MSGWGSQPFGTSPYGLGTPAVASDLGGSILRDETTGEARGSRKIDPSTGDYVLDDTGRIAGMSDIHQLVILAVSTTKGSAAVRRLGQELKLIDRITPSTPRRIDATLRAAVQHLVNPGLIEVVDTDVSVVRSGVVLARLHWRDLTTGKVHDTPVGG